MIIFESSFKESFGTNSYEICPAPGEANTIRVWETDVGGRRAAKPLEIQEFFARIWWDPDIATIVIGPSTQCGVCGGHATTRRMSQYSTPIASCLFCGTFGWYLGNRF